MWLARLKCFWLLTFFVDFLEDPVLLCLLVGAGPAHAKEVVKIPQLPEKQKKTSCFCPEFVSWRLSGQWWWVNAPAVQRDEHRLRSFGKSGFLSSAFPVVCSAQIISFPQTLQSFLAFESAGFPKQFQLRAWRNCRQWFIRETTHPKQLEGQLLLKAKIFCSDL